MSIDDPNYKNPYRANVTTEKVPPVDPVSKGTPQVVGWQMVYCSVMAFVYFACIVGGILLMLNAEGLADADPTSSPNEIRFMGILLAAVGVPFTCLFLAGLFFKRGMGAWIFHLILICIGLTSACCWPTNIPLIIFWIKHKDDIVG